MNPVMYLLSNPSVPMSTGKRGAQLAHAAVEAYIKSPDDNTKRVWHRGGHYTKIVLQCDDLQVAERYLNDRGFKTCLIIDEGRTEIDPMTATAIGCCIVDKDDAHVQATFSTFKLYRDDPAQAMEDYKRGVRDMQKAWEKSDKEMFERYWWTRRLFRKQNKRIDAARVPEDPKEGLILERG